MQDWINTPNEDGKLTPLHLAAYRGKQRLCQTICENKGDEWVLTGNGLSVIHLAS